ncbi:hypothetical protein CE91St43_24810 [Oscillospiraceae bacterium]|nr:hypothetical protein CE91St43_24810 [Oscillospiraceae bacterium]
MAKKLEGKTALVTSATRGIGLACALALAREGAKVAMGVRRLEAAREICDSHRAEGWELFPVYFDALRKESYAAMVDAAAERTGGIDILVNNFGMGLPAEDLDVVRGSEEAFFRILELNLGSVYRVSRLVIPHMRKRGGGSIVNISSIGGLIPDVTRTGYGVSKAAINNLTCQIALQFARDGIRCNAVLPGLTATDVVNRCVTVSVGTASARATLPPSTTRPTRRCTRPRTRSGTVLCWAAGSTAGQNRSGWFQTDFIYRSRRFLARRARVFTFIMGVEDTKRPGNHRFLGLFSPFRCPCTSALTRFSPLFPSVFLLTWIMAFVKTVNVLLYILSSACSALII